MEKVVNKVKELLFDKFWNPIYTALSDFDTYRLTLEDALKYVLKNLV